MKILINNTLCFYALIVLIMGASCKKEEGVVKTSQNIDEVINSNPDFSTFAYAIKKANLEIFTKGGGPFTFFIPSNSSFASIGINSSADIDKLDPLFLAIITTYHFQGVKRTFYEIPEGPNASMGSQTGVVQYGTRSPQTDKAYINGVEIMDKGTETSNGLYFKVAEVIQPPYYSNALQMMQALGGNYSLMLQAIAKTATTTSFTTTPATVFALPNSVMIANGYDSTTIANISGAAATSLTNTLRYHVIPQRIFKSDFRIGNTLTRFTGNSVTIDGTIGSFTIKGKNSPAPTTIGHGVATGTGVLYSISQLLKP